MWLLNQTQTWIAEKIPPRLKWYVGLIYSTGITAKRPATTESPRPRWECYLHNRTQGGSKWKSTQLSMFRINCSGFNCLVTGEDSNLMHCICKNTLLRLRLNPTLWNLGITRISHTLSGFGSYVSMGNSSNQTGSWFAPDCIWLLWSSSN